MTDTAQAVETIRAALWQTAFKPEDALAALDVLAERISELEALTQVLASAALAAADAEAHT